MIAFLTVQAHHTPVSELARDDNFDPIGDLKECGPLYEDLELCLAEHNREFSKCKHITKAVRMCMIAQAQQAKASKGNAITAEIVDKHLSH